jgi:uncharacterized membrane protein YdbT with pleckstrin-like domain
MDMHPDETVIYQGHPSWRSTFAFYAKGTLASLVVSVLVAVISLIGDGAIDWLPAILVFAVGVGLTVLIGFIRRMFTVYTITNQRLRIQRGIIARSVQQTRIERVQNVNTDQGIIDRVLQVGAVDFDTAGTTDADFRFDGVDDPEEVVAAVDRAQREHTRLAQEHGQPTDGL